MSTQLRVLYLVPLLLASYVQTITKPEKMRMNCYKDVKGTIYDYEAFSLGKERIQFKQYAGKHVLFVNVATYCGLTVQYPGMFVQEKDLYPISSSLQKGM
ncbi:epididymal secretory glutathione peroxidase isoform X2 [Psammomys obesus]|uniref:epididymal secretory glutathione peroxidase isoform X2 n=1 Tax=Psammomys obesus TaxID=48139 RepID=UPI002452D3ED|nr:epididymal secretory glutathione peroxidase isoform X2 [Psammomys obesus]